MYKNIPKANRIGLSKGRTWGRVLLVELDDVKKVVIYRCFCGREFEIPIKPGERRPKVWNCGALDCPYMARRKRQLLFPQKKGRKPGNTGIIEGPITYNEKRGGSPYRNRVTFNLPHWERDRLDDMVMLLRTNLTEVMRELARRWIKDNDSLANSRAEFYPGSNRIDWSATQQPKPKVPQWKKKLVRVYEEQNEDGGHPWTEHWEMKTAENLVEEQQWFRLEDRFKGSLWMEPAYEEWFGGERRLYEMMRPKKQIEVRTREREKRQRGEEVEE